MLMRPTHCNYKKINKHTHTHTHACTPTRQCRYTHRSLSPIRGHYSPHVEPLLTSASRLWVIILVGDFSLVWLKPRWEHLFKVLKRCEGRGGTSLRERKHELKKNNINCPFWLRFYSILTGSWKIWLNSLSFEILDQPEKHHDNKQNVINEKPNSFESFDRDWNGEANCMWQKASSVLASNQGRHCHMIGAFSQSSHPHRD